VLDGRRQLILYGAAQAIDDDAGIAAGHRRLRTAQGRPPEVDDATLAEQLREQHRVILKITPEKAFMND
jgi:hypothetical protein